ncbi:MAG: outer membrane beta-barrel protein [Terriglobales bacterium]
MKKLAYFALAASLLLGVAAAQNIPRIDVFGGYSYYSFDLPGNPSQATTSTRLAMNGWDVSGSFFRYHRLSAEADLSGHSVSNCEGNTFSCSNFSYMFGPRFNFREGSKITAFVHGLIGQDRGTFAYTNQGSALTDTSLSFAAGGGVDYWLMRHIGVQLGSVDYQYTRHLNDFNVPSQSNFRVNVGVVFRFGGDTSEAPLPKSRPAATVSSQPATVPVHQPAQPSVNVTSRGMSITALGVIVAPQEFDGAKIVEVEPGGTAEMASMKAGDLIKTVDGKPVRTPMELAAELSDKTGKVKIGIQRGDFSTETLILLSAH